MLIKIRTKSLILILILAVSTSLQAETSCDLDETTGKRPIPIIDYKNPTLDHKKGFLTGGELSCEVRRDYSSRKQALNRHYIEKGKYEGVDYEVFFNRGTVEVTAASTATWLINCDKDDMEDTVTCSMTKGAFLYIHLGADGESTSFGLIAETYPNTEIAVKVGKNTKISASSMAGIMMKTEIINQMKTNKKLITSYYKWPSQVKKVDKLSIDGFSVALTLMKKLHKESMFY